MSTTAAPARPLRSDARANRERVMTAALEAFAEHGRDASVEDIARRAGVGVGTLYRRFPTKTALAAQLAEDLVSHIHDLAETALREEPKGTAFESYVLAMGGLRSRYGRALVWLYGLEPAATRITQEVKPLVRRMIAQGQATGRLRSDVTEHDLNLLMWAIQGVLETTRDIAPEAWRRLVQMVFAGWHNVDEPTWGTPPLTVGQIGKITAGLDR
jgi:AcrR family transcriptional regulator